MAIVGAILLSLAALFAFAWPALTTKVDVGTAFAARTGCVCVNISGRTLEDCRKDFEPGMGLIRLEQKGATTRASVPLLGATEATYREGWGCLLEPYAS